jgi:protein-L-isoaspartate(D-aspartate) O-methyltransferase
MVKIARRGGTFSAEFVSPVAIFSCSSVRDPQLEAPLAKALSSRALLKLKSVRVDAHEPADTCLVHASDMCLSSAEPAATGQAAAT